MEAHFGAVSRGTEALVLGGRVPESQQQAMRGPHMGGQFPFPVKYGYACTGVVAAGDLPAGTQVFCLHPHQEAFTVPVAAVSVHRTPLDRAVLGANVETALNAVWDSGASAGDRIAVIGGGVVGCLIAWLLGQLPGAEVTLVDLLPERGATAAALGVGFALVPPVDCDVVVHASGAPAGLRTALAAAGPQATVLEVSWFGDREVSVPFGEAFHSRRLTIKSSQVGQIPPARAPRWTYARRMGKALALAADPALDVLFSSEGPFEALPSTLPRVVAEQGLCHRIRYR